MKTQSLKTNSEHRKLETVKGYESAVKAIRIHATSWDETNGKGRMVVSKGGLYANDNEGSGEFYEACCVNINDAENSAEEIYEIQTCW